MFSIPHSGIPVPGIPHDWSINCDCLHQHQTSSTLYMYVNHLASHAQSITNMPNMWNPLHHTFELFDIWNFDPRNGFSCSGCVVVGRFTCRYFKVPLFSSCHFSLVCCFTAPSLFHSSSLTKSLAGACYSLLKCTFKFFVMLFKIILP